MECIQSVFGCGDQVPEEEESPIRVDELYRAELPLPLTLRDYKNIKTLLKDKESVKDIHEKALITAVQLDIEARFIHFIDRANLMHQRLLLEDKIGRLQDNVKEIFITFYHIELAKKCLLDDMPEEMEALILVDPNRFRYLIQVVLKGKDYAETRLKKFVLVKSKFKRHNLPHLKQEFKLKLKTAKTVTWIGYTSRFYESIVNRLKEASKLNNNLSAIVPGSKVICRLEEDEVSLPASTFQIALFIFNYFFKELRNLVLEKHMERRLSDLMMPIVLGEKKSLGIESLRISRYRLSTVTLPQACYPIQINGSYMDLENSHLSHFAKEFLNPNLKLILRLGEEEFRVDARRGFPINKMIDWIKSIGGDKPLSQESLKRSDYFRDLFSGKQPGHVWLAEKFMASLAYSKNEITLIDQIRFSDIFKAAEAQNPLYFIKLFEWLSLSHREVFSKKMDQIYEALGFKTEAASVTFIPTLEGMAYQIETAFFKPKSSFQLFAIKGEVLVEDPWKETKISFYPYRKVFFSPYIKDKDFVSVVRLLDPLNPLQELKQSMLSHFNASLERIDRWIFCYSVPEREHIEDLKRLLAELFIKRDYMVKSEVDMEEPHKKMRMALDALKKKIASCELGGEILPFINSLENFTSC